jgi:hypothetical protein
MKDLILKRERIFNFLSLGLIAVSLFLEEPAQKVTVLVLGILGLLLLSILKQQKILIWVYLALLITAGIFSYIITKEHSDFF